MTAQTIQTLKRCIGTPSIYCGLLTHRRNAGGQPQCQQCETLTAQAKGEVR